MHKPLLFTLALISIASASFPWITPNMKDTYLGNIEGNRENGGMNCAFCTVMVSQSIRAAAANNEAVDDYIEHKLCKIFPTPLNGVCIGFIASYGGDIINALMNNGSADNACRATGLCTNATCNLFPNHTHNNSFQFPPMTFSGKFGKSGSQFAHHKLNIDDLTDVGKFDPWKALFAILATFANDHRPDVDFDNDTFSQLTPEARGYNWKGRDCDDGDASIYPGRAANPFKDNSIDFNCNGIYGKSTKTLKPWKDTLCANSSQMGFAVVGDSMGAHFELPEQWFNGSQWNNRTFNDFATRALDEFDRPYLSGWTGYYNYSEVAPGYTHSLYQNIYNRNRCNFKDYQNAGVNGGASGNTKNYILDSFRRNATNDHPVFLILELVGNDVCNSGLEYTNVETFSENIMWILTYLDTVLPPGSHVLTVGLADGELLWDTLWNQTHPLGCTYEDLYDYMLCLDLSPCAGWMNPNATIRNMTTTRAQQLSQVYQNLIANGTVFQNYDWDYMQFPAVPIFNAWVQAGNNPVELIEPVDGFHPSQVFHSLMADWYWEELEVEHPDWLGPENPFNEEIEQLFGDQGGYGNITHFGTDAEPRHWVITE